MAPEDNPTTTSLVRAAASANDSKVSRNQIAMIVGLVILIAGGVWSAAVVIYSGQAETVESLHSAEISRLEAELRASRERGDARVAREDDRCDTRMREVKDGFGPIQEALRQCLDRPIQIALPPDD